MLSPYLLYLDTKTVQFTVKFLQAALILSPGNIHLLAKQSTSHNAGTEIYAAKMKF